MQQKEAYTIEEFCSSFNISRSFFYKLKKQNRAPRIAKVGFKVIILREDVEQWRNTCLVLN